MFTGHSASSDGGIKEVSSSFSCWCPQLAVILKLCTADWVIPQVHARWRHTPSLRSWRQQTQASLLRLHATQQVVYQVSIAAYSLGTGSKRAHQYSQLTRNEDNRVWTDYDPTREQFDREKYLHLFSQRSTGTQTTITDSSDLQDRVVSVLFQFHFTRESHFCCSLQTYKDVSEEGCSGILDRPRRQRQST